VAVVVDAGVSAVIVANAVGLVVAGALVCEGVGVAVGCWAIGVAVGCGGEAGGWQANSPTAIQQTIKPRIRCIKVRGKAFFISRATSNGAILPCIFAHSAFKSNHKS
jgi:hypothetical protein